MINDDAKEKGSKESDVLVKDLRFESRRVLFIRIKKTTKYFSGGYGFWSKEKKRLKKKVNEIMVDMGHLPFLFFC